MMKQFHTKTFFMFLNKHKNVNDILKIEYGINAEVTEIINHENHSRYIDNSSVDIYYKED